MRRGAFLVGCILAACGGGTGVDIDVIVPGDVKIDRVELWVAYDQCYDCPNGVAWDQAGRATGNIYFLKDEAAIKAVLQGTKWVLHLDASSGLLDPPWVAVVGLQNDGKVNAVKVLRDVHIPASTVVTWQVYLHKATEATTDVMTPPPDPLVDHRAHVWQRGPTAELSEPTGCLAYQHWDGSSWQTEYFVPKTDPDCDGIPVDKECSEFWFNYKPSISACVIDAGVRLPNTCIVGVSLCADGVSSDRACVAAPDPLTCVSDAICDHCGDEIPVDGCVRSAIENAIAADAGAHYHCNFDATTEGAPCPGQQIALQLPYSNARCGTPVMHTLDKPFTEPSGSLVFGTAPNVAKFSLKPNTAFPCLVNIEWTGGTTEAFKDGVKFLLDVPYDNGTRALYPIEIRPTNMQVDCSMSSLASCEPGGPVGDGVVHCAESP
jgi:hypothetical protein